ncbi:uncharacterized protein LOC127136901 [Lathyrus oleraceus]|uniref:uncharacterized protein LOC127136901 n=1 Tax=Pisum sativum TaxID=3888 RepID=UPI0021D27296|nr:uncharacterized protein LOC127136901 [Pisum sativum]
MQIVVMPSSCGGFPGNTVDNPKNQTCKVIDTCLGEIIEQGKDEATKEGVVELEESGNQGEKEERRVTLDQLIDKNSPWRRTEKQILTELNPPLPDYIKPPFLIIKKKLVQEDEALMFTKFKKMLATLHISISFHESLKLMPNFVKFMKALLKGTKDKAVKEHVNMTEKDKVVISQAFPLKLKDPGKFTISCNIGEVDISYAMYDLGSSINVMPQKTIKDFKMGEVTPSNMTLTLADSYITQPDGILSDILVHVDVLVFPANFVVLDTKVGSGGFVILGRPFLEIGKAKIDVETGELILKSNEKKVVFKVYDWTLCVENLDTCYHLEEK